MFMRPKFTSLLIIVGAILCLFAVSGDAQAQGPTPAPTAPPQDCAECHLDVVAEWQNSPHAQASTSAGFTLATQGGTNPTCLACHTTGFNVRTGQFTHPNVTCEACHGQTPAQHPPQPVSIAKSVAVCETCHQSTVTEWEHSAHGEQQLACTTCHHPHSQTLRFTPLVAGTAEASVASAAATQQPAAVAGVALASGTSNDLCVNCHKEPRTDYAHTAHAEQTCTDCHWYRAVDWSEHAKTGVMLPTGHDNEVLTKTCLNCHACIDANGSPEACGVATAIPAVRVQDQSVQNKELEARLLTVQAQSDNEGSIRLFEGVLLGSVLGGGLMAFLMGLGRLLRKPATTTDQPATGGEGHNG